MDTAERVALKILHIIDSGGLYGAEVMLLNLMKEQVALGLQPILASIGEPGIVEKPLESEAKKRGLVVKAFRMRPGPNFPGALKLLRFARKERVDLLHSHGYKGNILLGLMPRILRQLPIVATVHGWTWTGGISRMGLYEWLDRISLQHLDRVILVNEAMKQHPRLKRHSAIALEVVNNGIPEESNPEQQSEEVELDQNIINFCRGGYTIGAVGRFSKEKGFDLLIESVARLVDEKNNIRLLLIGDGGLRISLEEQIQSLGLTNHVYMPGYVNNANRYLPYLKIFALPSLTEGLPIVLLEAMMAGVPVVASRVGGVPNVLDQGRSGLLMKPGDKDSLTQGITEIINNPAAAKQRAQDAGKLVREKYSSQAMAKKYREIYKSILQK